MSINGNSSNWLLIGTCVRTLDKMNAMNSNHDLSSKRSCYHVYIFQCLHVRTCYFIEQINTH